MMRGGLTTMTTMMKRDVMTLVRAAVIGLGVLSLLCATACSKSSSSDGQSEPATQSDAASGATTAGPYTWPDGINRKDPKYAKCWAALRADPRNDFKNPYDNIKGPAEVAELRGLDADGVKKMHADWTGQVERVVAGTAARVTLYEKPNFKGGSVTLEPEEEFEVAGSSISGVGSLKIEYTGS
ncbi:MAG: hypothetical protein AAFX05_12220 [Planctomycetota bacterium]